MSTISRVELTVEAHEFFVGLAPEGDTEMVEGVMVTTEGLEVSKSLWVEQLAMIPIEIEVTNEEVFGGE